MNLFANQSITSIAGGLLLGFMVAAVGIFSLYFWIVMLLDALMRKSKKYRGAKKLLWVVFIACFEIIGAAIYWLQYKPKIIERKNLINAGWVVGGVFAVMLFVSIFVAYITN